jgi:hypothetical protein
MANSSMQSMAAFWPTFGFVLVSLVLFGLGDNALTGYLERTGRSRGFVTVLVAGGEGVTILASGFLIGLAPALIMLACFTAYRMPTIVGSIWRYMGVRAADEKAAAELAKEALDESPSPDREE